MYNLYNLYNLIFNLKKFHNIIWRNIICLLRYYCIISIFVLKIIFFNYSIDYKLTDYET